MDLLTVREAAAMLRVSQVTLRRYVASGKLPAVRVGRNMRIEREAAVSFAVPSSASRDAEIEDELSHMVPKRGFSPGSSLWDLVGFIKDDGPTDLAENHDRYLAEAYGDLHEAADDSPQALRSNAVTTRDAVISSMNELDDEQVFRLFGFAEELRREGSHSDATSDQRESHSDTATDPLLSLIGAGRSAEPTNVREHKDAYLAEAFEERRT